MDDITYTPERELALNVRRRALGWGMNGIGEKMGQPTDDEGNRIIAIFAGDTAAWEYVDSAAWPELVTNLAQSSRWVYLLDDSIVMPLTPEERMIQSLIITERTLQADCFGPY